MMERGLYVNEQRADYGFFTGALVYCLGNHRCSDFDRSDPQLELALRSHRYAGCLPPWQRIPAGDIFPAGCSIDCSEYLGIYAEIKEGLDKNGSLNEL